MAQENKVVTVKLTTDTKEKLQHLSKIKSRSTHWLMKKAIDDYVEKEEQQERLRLDTLDRWQEAELGNVVDHDKVISWLDNWGTKNDSGRP